MDCMRLGLRYYRCLCRRMDVLKRVFVFSLAALLYALFASPAKAESVGPISEETPPLTCNAGRFVGSLKCTGRYCDNLRVSCRTVGKEHVGESSWGKWLSEETRRGNYRTNNCPGSRYIAGMACKGKYCDKISLYCVKLDLPVLPCKRTKWVSEENGGFLSFPPNTVATAKDCKGRYCDNKRFAVCEIADE